MGLVISIPEAISHDLSEINIISPIFTSCFWIACKRNAQCASTERSNQKDEIQRDIARAGFRGFWNPPLGYENGFISRGKKYQNPTLSACIGL